MCGVAVFLMGVLAISAEDFHLTREATAARSDQVSWQDHDGSQRLHTGAGSRLGYAVPDGMLKQGTILIGFEPNADWLEKTDAPDIIFQLGGRHWESNSFTLLREPDGRLVFQLHGAGDSQAAFAVPITEILPGRINTAAVAYDEGSVEVFLNGRKLASHPALMFDALASDALSVGSPYFAQENWGFNGIISNLVASPRKWSDAEILKQLADWSLRFTPPLNEKGNYVKSVADVIRIGTPAWELQVDRNAQPMALYDKRAGRFVIADWNRGGGAWWSFVNPDQPGQWIDNRSWKGQAELTPEKARFLYTDAATGSVMIVEVTPGGEDELRFRYELTNRFSKEIDFVYFPGLSGIDKSTGGWAFQAHWNGEKYDLSELNYECWGGPGHLSMLVSALKAGNSTMLFYPQDQKGAVKFAISHAQPQGPDGVVNLSWQNRDYVQSGETFREPYEYTLFALGDVDLVAVADQYRKWAQTQPWWVTYAEKLAAAPVIERTHNGVLKMGGLEAVNENGNIPAERDWKEANCKILTYDYNRFLEIARGLEAMYDIKPAYRYDGWWGRFDSRYPDYFPVDPELGDFAEFIAANRRENRLVYLHTNPIQYDEEAPSFKLENMSLVENGEPCKAVWSRNTLYFASPKLAIPDEVRAIRQMVEYGVQGIFEDVIGCTTMVDINPLANYPARVRDTGTQGLIALCRALQEASPGTFRGTEGGEERRMPYYSAFMMGAGDSRKVVPFLAMVYGECVANATGIEGGTYAPLERNRRLLFGQILGLDARGDWAREYDAEAQMYLKAQQVAKQVLGQRMIGFEDGESIWASEWPNAVTVANLTDQPVAEADFGRLHVEGLGDFGVAMVTENGDFAVWNCRRVCWDGKELFRADAPGKFAAVRHGEELLLGNLGEAGTFRNLQLRGCPLNQSGKVRPQQNDAAVKNGAILLESNQVLVLEDK